jgi:hypothetical protein
VAATLWIAAVGQNEMTIEALVSQTVWKEQQSLENCHEQSGAEGVNDP